MRNLKEQTAFKFATLVLVLALLMPSVVKFSHVFKHHHHEICKGEYQTHLHTSDIECSFYKFKISSHYTIPTITFEFFPIEENHQEYSDAYSFLSDFQNLHFSLRGPPQIDFI